MKNYTIVRNATGDRFVKTNDGRVIPTELAACAAGKDAWMREIQCKCRDCNQPFLIGDLINNGQYCETCATVDIHD